MRIHRVVNVDADQPASLLITAGEHKKANGPSSQEAQ